VSEIPEDRADDLVEAINMVSSRDKQLLIAKRYLGDAVRVERERCAKIAEGRMNQWSGSRDMDTCMQEAAAEKEAEHIAAAIRSHPQQGDVK